MATETKFAGTAAEISTAPFDGGNTSWVNPTNAEGDTTSTSAQASGGGAWLSFGLKLTNFGFTSVSGTINSILVEIESLQSDDGSTFIFLRIVKGGVTGTNTTEDGKAVPTVKGFAASGSTLWGLSWTADDITATNFGVVFSVNQPNGFPPGISTDIYRVKITVDYTANTAPGQPTGLSATAVGQTQVDLSWTAPASDGGSAITGYKIERKVGSGSFSDLVADTGNTTTTYSNTGLTASTLYTYRVSAINAIGTSIASSEASDTTDAAPASATVTTPLQSVIRSDNDILSLPNTSSISKITSFNGLTDGVIHNNGSISFLFAVNSSFVDSGEHVMIGGLPVAIAQMGLYRCLIVMVDNEGSDDGDIGMFLGNPIKLYRRTGTFIVSCYVSNSLAIPDREIVINGIPLAADENDRLIVVEKDGPAEEEKEAIFCGTPVLFNRIRGRWYLAVATV